MNAAVIEYRNNRMQRELGAVWKGERPYSDVATIEAKYGYKHGWFFDETIGRVFQNDGGRNIVWADQPVTD